MRFSYYLTITIFLDSRDASICWLLHAVLQPKKINQFYKPTIRDAQEDMICIFANLNDKVKKEEEIRKEYEEKNIKLQPRFFAIGDSVLKLNNIYLMCDNILYKLPTFLKALDIAVMLIYVFNLDFSPVSRTVWLFLADVFYNKPVPESFNQSCEFKKFIKLLKPHLN